MSGSQWQVKCKSLAERNAHLLELGVLSDCTFQVKGKDFKAHRLILAASSPVFEAMFYGGMASHNPIQLEDVEPQVFGDLLRYIYTDGVEVKTVDSAYEIYTTADKYLLPELMERCIHYIYTHLNTSNVCRAYQFAKFHNKPELKEKCLRLIKRQCESVLSDDSFIDMDIETLQEILDLPDLNISNEIKLFEAIEKYYNNQKEIQSDPFKSTINSPPLTIRKALQKIRFLTFPPKLFVNKVSESGLLTDADVLGLLKNIVSPECTTPIPEGFSTSTESRRHESPITCDTKHYCIRVHDEEEKLNAMFQICKRYSRVLTFCDSHDKMKIVRGRIVQARETNSLDELMINNERDSIMQRYNDGNNTIAPSAIAKSIDMKQIYGVVNYDLPSDEDYIHTVARKWWEKCKPLTINLVTDENVDVVKNIEDYYFISMCDISFSEDIMTPIENHRKFSK